MTLYSKIISRKQQGNSSTMLHCQQQHCALRAVCTCHKDLLGIANKTYFILNVFTLEPIQPDLKFRFSKACCIALQKLQ